MSTSAPSSLPPDLFDTTTLLSLLLTVLIALTGYLLSHRLLPPATSPTLRFFFVWHAADALCHFILEGSYLYLSLLVSAPASSLPGGVPVWPTPHNFLSSGHGVDPAVDTVWGPQAAAGSNPMAALWMVYARADRRWAGADLGVISLELLTVLVTGPMACWCCWLLVRRDPMVYFWMSFQAACELYGGFMTFCPEWLTGNVNLDGSNFMYLYVYLCFFNLLWVFIPLYVLWVSYGEISSAFKAKAMKAKAK